MTPIETLRRDGIVEAGTFHDAPAMLAYLDARPRWNNHVKQAGEPVPENPSSTCWSLEDVLLAPGWLEKVLGFLPFAEGYLGTKPLLYSVNAFTTYPKDGPTQGDIQEFHRDEDDVKFVVLFCYLTDVTRTEDGPHQFDKGTQNGAGPCIVETVFGPAGTMFLADTRGLHRGVRPTSKPRTMAWARFGVTDPPASYGWDKLSPVDALLLGERYQRLTSEEMDSVRLVVR